MEVRNFQPSFGMAVRYEITPKSEIIRHIAIKVPSIDAAIRADELIKSLEKLPAEIELFLNYNKSGKPRLAAVVGEKSFKENFFTGPITTLRNALKAAKKLPIQSSEHPYCEIE